MAGHLTLGLYNCYDPKRWHDIMRITLARAAPVAAAFGCDVATFGFPFAQARRRGAKASETGLTSALDVARFVAEEDATGEGGERLAALARGGRFHLLDFPPQAAFPPGLGRAVATTPAPEAAKAVTPLAVAEELAAGRSQLLVFGLGPHGLPREVLAASPVHLEMTGKGISLETATALGALPAMVATHLAHLRVAP